MFNSILQIYLNSRSIFSCFSKPCGNVFEDSRKGTNIFCGTQIISFCPRKLEIQNDA